MVSPRSSTWSCIDCESIAATKVPFFTHDPGLAVVRRIISLLASGPFIAGAVMLAKSIAAVWPPTRIVRATFPMTTLAVLVATIVATGAAGLVAARYPKYTATPAIANKTSHFQGNPEDGG